MGFSHQILCLVLLYQVNECTQGASLTPDMPHLSSLEVHLLRHPLLMNKIMGLLEKDNVRLAHLQEWKNQEQVFWKWMVRHWIPILRNLIISQAHL